MAKKEHYKRMKDPEYHKNGGCVCRHVSHFDDKDPCSHRGQGYLTSVESRKSLYNSYDPKAAKDLPTRKLKSWRSKKGKLKHFRYQVKNPLKDPTCWYIGRGTNFTRNMKVPYLHNYHHIIPNGELNNRLIIKTKGYEDASILIQLMAVQYNINNGVNVVLLPKEQKIARIIQLPTHCPNRSRRHLKYSKHVGKQLEDMAKDIIDEFEKMDCEEKKLAIENLRDSLERLSKRLLPEIVKLGKSVSRAGRIKGVSIEQIGKLAK